MRREGQQGTNRINYLTVIAALRRLHAKVMNRQASAKRET
jgi:hypothetical protein